MLKEWPLVGFSILGQAAVGFYVLAGVPLFFSGGVAGGSAGGEVRLTFLLGVLGLMAAATALSFFHLDRPTRAFRVLSNIGSSWLSREILFEIGFMGITGLLGFCEWRRIGGAVFLKTLFVLGGLAGVLFLLAMTKLYMLPAVPAWNHPSMPISFLLTALVLGISASTVFFRMFSEPPPFYRALLLASLLSVAAGLVGAVLLAPGRGLFGARPGPSLRPPGGGLSFFHAARIILLLAGTVMLAAVVVAKGSLVLGVAGRPTFLLAVFFTIAAAEVSGRFLFYSFSGPRS
jgi:anaerobic dimethyl sulfoxide reductase subunit C (anchor subunit)